MHFNTRITIIYSTWNETIGYRSFYNFFSKTCPKKILKLITLINDLNTINLID